MSKKNYIYLLAGTGLLVTGVATGLVFSANAQTVNTSSNTNQNLSLESKQFGRGFRIRQNLEELSAIKDAIANKDFNAWKTAVESSDLPNKEELLAKINESNFNTYIQMFEAVENRDFTTAESIRSELGLTQTPGMQRRENRQAIDEALANNDYSAWQEAVKSTLDQGSEILSKIDSQEKFEKLVESYNLHQQGFQIEKDLGVNGLRYGMGGGRHGNKAMDNGFTN